MPVVQPVHRRARIAAGTPLPMTAFARKVLIGAARRRTCPASPATTTRRACRTRATTTSSTSASITSSTSGCPGFVRVGQQKNDAVRGAEHRRAVRQQPERLHQRRFARRSSPAAPGSLGRASVLDARLGISHTDAGKKPPVIGGPSMFELYGITGLPENDPDDHRRPDAADDHRLLAARTPGHQPAVPEPVQRQPARQPHPHPRPPQREGRLRVHRDQHRGAGHQPALRARHLQQPVLAAGRRGGEQPVQPRRLLLRRAHPVRARQPDRREDAAARHLRLRAGRHHASTRR